MELLIKRGADVNILANSGEDTALIAATSKGGILKQLSNTTVINFLKSCHYVDSTFFAHQQFIRAINNRMPRNLIIFYFSSTWFLCSTSNPVVFWLTEHKLLRIKKCPSRHRYRDISSGARDIFFNNELSNFMIE